jgi:hypothetical protein
MPPSVLTRGTPNEARRSLKRRLSDGVNHRLISDLAPATNTAT